MMYIVFILELIDRLAQNMLLLLSAAEYFFWNLYSLKQLQSEIRLNGAFDPIVEIGHVVSKSVIKDSKGAQQASY